MATEAERKIKGELVELPKRDPRLPRIYRWQGHHLLSALFGEETGTTYLVLLDDSVEGRRLLNQYIREEEIPTTTDDGELFTKGYIRLTEGDCVITRLLHGSGEEKDDRLEGWFLPSKCIPEAYMRTSNSCSYVYWVPKKTISPVQGTSLETEDEHADSRETRRLILKVAGEVAAYSIETAAPHVASQLRTRADALNLPRVGSQENNGEEAYENFKLVQGSFGIKHIDKNDALLGFTNLLAASDLRGKEDPGRFYLFAFGMYVLLLGICSVAFSGRHAHGGFPPTAQPNSTPDPRSVRLVLVTYPPKAQFDAQAKFRFADTPDGELNLCREWYDPQYDNIPVAGQSQSVSMIQNGLSIMEEESYMQYLGRGLIQLLEGVRRQVPPCLDVRLDADAILAAISYQPSDEASRRVLPPWPLAPGQRSHEGAPTAEPQDLDQGTELWGTAGRKEVSDAWKTARRRVRRFFPELDDKWSKLRVAPWNPEDESDEQQLLVDFDFDEEFEDPDADAEEPAPEQRTARPNQKRAAAPAAASEGHSKRARQTNSSGVVFQKNMSDSLVNLSLTTPTSIAIKRKAASGDLLGEEGEQLRPSRRRRVDSPDGTPGPSGAQHHDDVPGLRRSKRIADLGPGDVDNGHAGASQTSGSVSSQGRESVTPLDSAYGDEEDALQNGDEPRPRLKHITALSEDMYNDIYHLTVEPARAGEPSPLLVAQNISAYGYTDGEVGEDEDQQPQPKRTKPTKQRARRGPSNRQPWKACLEKVLSLDGLESCRKEYQTLVEQTETARPANDIIQGQRFARRVVERSGQWKCFENEYIHLLPQMWGTLDEDGGKEAETLFEMHLARAHVLATVGVAWRWLDIDLPAMVNSYVEGGLEEVPAWLEGLEAQVREYLSGAQAATFNAADVGLNIPGAVPQFRKGLPGPVAQAQLNVKIIAEIRSILMGWLKYPTNNLSRLRGTFIRILLSKLGESAVLLLPGIHDVFSKPGAKLFGDTMSVTELRRAEPSVFDGVAAALAAMPVAQKGSPEHRLLASIGENIYKGRERIRKLLHPSLGGRHARLELDDVVLGDRVTSATKSLVLSWKTCTVFSS
ncbi:hypothetical protein GSI_09613 [Ganoderma sinense ZZ0214-1]|uniref:Uncharacterized protein n=1 Tax=Ganoderma sinense ZZ0214-1 TaxID=1077348 RepID=A0A2G8S3L3_9APHY|nr:hypothetical protein GSI_09613 [Ganoderma sinense ZZ0214-1]